MKRERGHGDYTLLAWLIIAGGFIIGSAIVSAMYGLYRLVAWLIF